MKLLSAVVLLFFSLAYAQPRSEHQLRQPQFYPGKVHSYDVTINMTSGVPGLSSQVAKSVIKTELKVYPKTNRDLIIQMQSVRVGQSSPGVSSYTEDISLTEDSSLERELRTPTSAVYENGKIRSYSVIPTESLAARKIRKSILRNLEIYLDEKYLGSGSELSMPITYNVTKSSPGGSYESHYIVTSSPYYDFPYEKNVFNITRFDNYEGIPYVAYKTHHNFEKQGCPEVCTKDHTENKYGAGCPSGHEPHHSPIKRSFVQRYNLLTVGSTLIIDSINTVETHLADVYDQNMEVTIQTEMKFRKAVRDSIPDITGQQIVSDLNDMNGDIDEEEIEHICQYPDNNASINKVQSLLNSVVETVLKNEIHEEKSQKVGEVLVTIQKMMQRFSQGNFRTLQRSIVSYSELKRSSEQEKVKRQIWVDLLPLIGTSESVSYIVSYIKEGINTRKQDVSFWETKSILNSLSENIHRPSEKTINELTDLLEVLKEKDTPGHMLFASAYMAVSKVISSLCSETVTVSDDRSGSSRSWRRWMLPKTTDEDNKFVNNMRRQCPETVARKFIDEVTHDLLSTSSKVKRMIYIEALSRTGLEEVLPTLRKYIYGQHHEEIFSGLSHSYVDYLRTAAIYSLHNIATKSPRSVQDLLVPVFFNSTEPPKVRTAAFSVIIQTKPTLSLLELVAFNSWDEPSEEVGSYVTSSLETFGNSSLPCHQITAQRIKKVIPQLKRFSVGAHKAKNVIYDYWNDVRRVGLLNHIDYMPSNESIIPSALYGYTGYYTDSMADNYFEYSLLPQGLPTHKIIGSIMKMFGVSPPEDIPKSSESKIFSDMNIASRNSEPWRLFAYNKLFYSTSYYYFDEEESKTHSSDFITMMKDVLDHYIQKDSQGRYSGHFTKLFIPSSFHAKTISQSLPYPVQFEKKNPILFFAKVKSEKTSSSGMGYKVDITPSVYSSIIHTNEILNVGDCKRIGVYHDHKTVATFPVTVSFEVQRNGRFSFGYKFQELPKNIFSHSSEAGTYAGKNHLEPFPSTEDRRTIKTIPSQFVNSHSWDVFGMPIVNMVYKTEDIEHGIDTVPHTWEEINDYVSRYVLNAGWRRRSVEIVRERDSKTWTPNTEVVFNVQYSKVYSSQGKSGSESDWSRYLEFNDRLDKHDTTSYASEGQKIYEKLTSSLSHCKHSIRVEAEQKSRSSSEKMADLSLEYLHTPERFLHFLHFETSSSKPSTPIQVTGDYVIGFIRRPNEFKYNEQYGKQQGVAIGGLSFGKTTPFTNPFVVAKAVFKYKPLHEVLNLEVDSSKYEPETHEECMKNKEEGMYQSPACVKAIREKSLYNNLRMHAIWTQEPSKSIKEIGKKINSAFKYTFYTHMNMSKKSYESRSEESSKSFHLEATYIDKMTTKPVYDIVMENPSEILNFTKISLGKIRPVSSIESIVESYVASFTNNTYPATCSLTGNYVKTYDMKSYRMPRSTPACSYVLSTHCTENKKFSVLVKHDPNSHGTEEIQIYLGRDEIVLVPGTRNSYKIKYNGHYITVKYLTPVVLNPETLLTAVVQTTSDGGSFIEINANKAGIKVTYDGEHVKIQVDPRYKGELCGLCSEFNGEITREYRGVERCLYMHEEDFAKSSIVGQCGDKRPQFKVLCSSDDATLWARRQGESDEDEDEDKPITKRNVVTSKGNKLCFSTKPVPVCENSAQPRMTESREIDFHCLPKQDVHARKLVTESKRRILAELETKAVDYSENIEVAKMC